MAQLPPANGRKNSSSQRDHPPATPPQWGANPAQPPQPHFQQAPYGDSQWGAPPPGYQPPGPQFQPTQQQQAWQQPYQPPARYAPPPRRRKHTGLKVFTGICVGILALVIIAVAASPKKPAAPAAAASTQQAAAAPSQSAAPAHSTAAAVAAATTVATFSGSGIETTPKFTVSSTWKLNYSFDCSSFGSQGNFQVFEDGGGDLNGLEVNDLAEAKTGSTYAYNDAGSHYLEVNSECSWTVKVTDQGS